MKRPTFPSKKVMPRYRNVAVVLSLLCAVVLVRAAYLIYVESDFWIGVGTRFGKSKVVLYPTRGNILAADGQVLATSLPEYRMFMDFMSYEKDSARNADDQYRRDTIIFAKVQEVLTEADSIRLGTKAFLKRKRCPPLVQPLTPNARLDTIARGMHRLFPDINPDSFKVHMVRGRLAKRHNWPVYKRKVTYLQYREVRKLPLFSLSSNLGGFYATEYRKRKNPFGRLAIRTVGDLYGEKDSARCGLELAFDSMLRGKPGVAHRQRVYNRYLVLVDTLPENGCDVHTTLDVSMQDICEKALGDQLRELEAESGVCILMEVATGDVKAITSQSRLANGNYAEISSLAVSNLMEPGSVFKPMSFMVAMDDGYIDLNTMIDTGSGKYEMYGRWMKDSNWRNGGNGYISAAQVIQMSSNVGTSRLIDQAYHNQPRKFIDGLYRIGVAEDLKLPIPGYAKPYIRYPGNEKHPWYKTTLPWMSIGYETQIPPISTLTFYNGVANGGRMVRPRFVTAITKDGEVVREYPVEVIREHMCKDKTLKNIQECLFRVVNEKKHATGKQARSKYFHVSGKTGTAQIWTGGGFSSQYLVTFAGYFPSEKPRYSMIVCIRKRPPAYGGLHCAPVFKRVAETIMAQQLDPDFSKSIDTVNTKTPLLLPGNLNALQSAMADLGIRYTAAYNPADMSLAWGGVEEGTTNVLHLTDTPAGTMPDLTGYGLRDAVYRMERLGLRVRAKGVGQVVSQSLKPGTPLRKGQTVEITLSTAANGKKPAAHVPKQPAATQPPATASTAEEGQKAKKQEGGSDAPKNAPPKKKN